MHRTELAELIRNGESYRVEFKRDDEEARLYVQSGRLPYDRKPVPGATLDELDRRRLGNCFRDFRAQDGPEADDGAGFRTPQHRDRGNPGRRR